MGKDRSRLRVGSVNVGSLRGRSDEVVEMVGRRNLDFCCLQETRWRGKNARRIGSYKIFWSGYEAGLAGVGILVEEQWIDKKVIEVKRINERLMVLRVIVGKSVLNLVCGLPLEKKREMAEKEDFFASLGEVLAKISDGEKLINS